MAVAAGRAKPVREPIGLVLAGGGAKGAYEVGVWESICELGLSSRVRAISGTSVGGINTALFASGTPAAKCEGLWLEHMGKVYEASARLAERISEKRYSALLSERLKVDAELAGIAVDDLPKDTVDLAKRETRGKFDRDSTLAGVSSIAETVAKIRTGESPDGLCDSTALREVLDVAIPGKWPKNAPAAYVSALDSGKWKLASFKLNGLGHRARIDRLLATTAIPGIFDTVAIDGRPYVDGGWEERGGDNVPAMPILANHPDIKTIIVVYLASERNLDETRRAKIAEAAGKAGVRVVEVIPSENIGGGFGGWQGVFDSSPETAQRLISIGRADAMKALSGAFAK